MTRHGKREGRTGAKGETNKKGNDNKSGLKKFSVLISLGKVNATEVSIILRSLT